MEEEKRIEEWEKVEENKEWRGNGKKKKQEGINGEGVPAGEGKKSEYGEMCFAAAAPWKLVIAARIA